MRLLAILILSTLSIAPLQAQDKLPLPVAAKFLKIICTADGGMGKVACASASMIPELEKLEVGVDAGAPIAWADSSADLQTFQKQGKAVVGSSLDLLKAGALLALVVEGGKPSIYISAAGRGHPNIPGTVKKIARAI